MAQLEKLECPWNQWQEGGSTLSERTEYGEKLDKRHPGGGEHTQLADELISSLITPPLCLQEAFDAGFPEKLSS